MTDLITTRQLHDALAEARDGWEHIRRWSDADGGEWVLARVAELLGVGA